MTFIDDFKREYMAYNRISEARQRESVKVLLEFEATLGERSLVQVTASDFAAYLAELLEDGYHVNTIRKRANMLRPFFRWMFERRHITAEQLLDLRNVKDPRGATGRSTPRPYGKPQLEAFWRELDARFPLLSDEQYRRFVKRWLKGTSKFSKLYNHGMRLQVEAVVHLALDCGLRRSEIYGLKPDDLHYDNAYLVVRGKADPHTGQAKTRQVPFTPAARKAVQRWLDHRALLHCEHDSTWISLWSTAAGNPMWESRFQHLLSETLGGWELHRFRHTCATIWLRSGMALEKVQSLMGHATLEQTLAYAEVTSDDVELEMEKYGRQFEKQTGRAA